MLSLLKKSDAPPPVQPFWHPDFRSREKLPDIKVVRTTFWINGPAIFVVLAVGLYLGYTEVQLHSLKKQIADTEARIKRDEKPSEQFVAMFEKFKPEETRINEVNTFVKSKPVFSNLLLRLGETLPPNIAIDTIDLRETMLILRVSVRGDPVAASKHAVAYRAQLAADKQLAALFDDVSSNQPARSPTTNRMTIEFQLRVKGAKK